MTTKKKSTKKNKDTKQQQPYQSQYDRLKESDPVLWMMCENIRTMPPINPWPFRATDFSSRNNNKVL